MSQTYQENPDYVAELDLSLPQEDEGPEWLSLPEEAQVSYPSRKGGPHHNWHRPKVYRGYFETPFHPKSPYLHGEIEAAVIEAGGVEPNTVIRVENDWYVDIRWSLKGTLMPLICGTWCIRLYMESMGPGKEFVLPRKRHVYKRVNPCGNGKYHYRLKIPRGTIKPKHCGIPYKPVVSITYLDSCKRPGCIAGFVEGPMLQFYESGKGRNGHHRSDIVYAEDVQENVE